MSTTTDTLEQKLAVRAISLAEIAAKNNLARIEAWDTKDAETVALAIDCWSGGAVDGPGMPHHMPIEIQRRFANLIALQRHLQQQSAAYLLSVATALGIETGGTLTDLIVRQIKKRTETLAKRNPEKPDIDPPPPNNATTERDNPPADPKKGMSLAEANILVRDYLAANAKDNPAAIRRDDVAKATGVSTGLVSNTPAWKAFQEQRKKEKKIKERIIPLSKKVAACIPCDNNEPAEAAAQQIKALLDEQKADEAEQNQRHAQREEARRRNRRHEPS